MSDEWCTLLDVQIPASRRLHKVIHRKIIHKTSNCSVKSRQVEWLKQCTAPFVQERSQPQTCQWSGQVTFVPCVITQAFALCNKVVCPNMLSTTIFNKKIKKGLLPLCFVCGAGDGLGKISKEWFYQNKAHGHRVWQVSPSGDAPPLSSSTVWDSGLEDLVDFLTTS